MTISPNKSADRQKPVVLQDMHTGNIGMRFFGNAA
jgi:hypothetical protein